MNESLKKFKIKDRNDPNRTVEITRYVINPKSEPIGALMGKFAPWSGPNGHGKLVVVAKQMFKDVIIVSPNRSGKDKKVDIFNDEQKEQIINLAEPNIPFFRVQPTTPIRMFTQIIDFGYDRPVLIIGKDREQDFNKYFIKYNKNNKPIEDMDHPDFGKGEFIVVSREEEDTSSSKVRDALMNGNQSEFIKLTGFDNKMWEIMQNMIKKNKNTFSEFYYE
jgi:phosphopantetheine adenylyltransferase